MNTEQTLREALEAIIKATHSHVDGRDLLAELHPRNMLDIKRRVDGRETWFEGDWLSNLWAAVKDARAALALLPQAQEQTGEVADALNKLETALRFQRNNITPTGDEGVEYMLALQTLRAAATPSKELISHEDRFSFI